MWRINAVSCLYCCTSNKKLHLCDAMRCVVQTISSASQRFVFDFMYYDHYEGTPADGRGTSVSLWAAKKWKRELHYILLVSEIYYAPYVVKIVFVGELWIIYKGVDVESYRSWTNITCLRWFRVHIQYKKKSPSIAISWNLTILDFDFLVKCAVIGIGLS